VPQLLAADYVIPAHPCVARTNRKDRVAQTEDPHDLVVGLVEQDISKLPPVARRCRDAPVQPCISKEELFLRPRLDLDQAGPDLVGNHFRTLGEPRQEASLVTAQAIFRPLDSGGPSDSMELPDGALVLNHGRLDEPIRRKGKPLVLQGLDHSGT
jgi:hypothetical protein